MPSVILAVAPYAKWQVGTHTNQERRRSGGDGFGGAGIEYKIFELGRGNGMHKQCFCFLLPFLVLKVLFRMPPYQSLRWEELERDQGEVKDKEVKEGKGGREGGKGREGGREGGRERVGKVR